MHQRRMPVALSVLMIVLGSGLVLSACTQALPIIPITALRQITPATPFARIAMGLVGVVLLVAGFSLVKFLIQLIGFLGGGMVGLYIVQIAFPSAGSVSFIGFIVGGIIGIIIAVTAADVGVLLVGGLIGVALAQQAWPYLENIPAPWYGLVICGVIGGVLTLMLMKYWVAALTSLIGAPLLGMALNLQPAYWAILLVAGILIQTVISRQRPGPGL